MTDQEPELVIVGNVKGKLNADVMKSHLESEGIPVLLQSDLHVMGGINVLVPQGLPRMPNK